MVFDKIKKAFGGETRNDESSEEYLEIDLHQDKKDKKVKVTLFDLDQYEDVNDILTALREGYCIAIISISKLKKRDSIELKRAISKIRKTIEALDGSISGFKDDIVIAAPSFTEINRAEKKKRDATNRFSN